MLDVRSHLIVCQLLFTPSCIETTSERSNSYTPQMSYLFFYTTTAPFGLVIQPTNNVLTFLLGVFPISHFPVIIYSVVTGSLLGAFNRLHLVIWGYVQQNVESARHLHQH